MKNDQQGMGKLSIIFPICFALAYISFAELGHSLSFPGDFATFWPPSGLFVAVLVLARMRQWPIFILTAISSNLFSDVYLHNLSIYSSLGFTLANTLEATLGALVIHKFAGTTFLLNCPRNIFMLMVPCALISPMLSAVVGALTVSLNGGEFWAAWRLWWLSDFIGIVSFSPLIIHAFTSKSWSLKNIRLTRVLESLFAFGGLMLVVSLVFGFQSQPLVWTVLPLMLWIALRFEVGGVSLAIVLVTVLMVHNTTEGRGPFAAGLSIYHQMMLARSFILILSVSFLTFGSIVSERRMLTQVVNQERARWRELFEHMEDHVFSIDLHGRFIQANRACREALGYTEAELLSLNINQVVHPEELPRCEGVMEKQLKGEKVRVKDARIVSKDGRVINVEGITEMHFENDRPLYSLSVFQDVTERLENQLKLDEYRHSLEASNKRLELLASTDALTQIKNRRTFQMKLEEETKRSRRNLSPLSLLLIDVDHFKSFNDSFGHPAGDEALKKVARVLEETARSTDLVARYGGEEFAVLLPDTDGEGATVLAEKIRRNILRADWQHRDITVSIGVASQCMTGENEDELTSDADKALYRSKKQGRNRVSFAENLISC